MDGDNVLLGDQATSTVELGKGRVLYGCNGFHRGSVFRQPIDLGSWALRTTSDVGPEFADRFVERFVRLKTLIPDSDIDPAFLERLGSPGGMSLEAALLEATLAVETAALSAMHFLDRIAFAAILYGEGVAEVEFVWETQIPRFSRAAVDIALTGVAELLPVELRPPLEKSFAERLEAMIEHAASRRLSPTTAVLRLAAKRRGLPFENVSGQHFRIGQGRKQHHIYSSMSGFTSMSAAKLANDKRQTSRRLRELGLPAPEQRRVRNLKETERAAARLGGRVVLKPIRGSRGRGVTAGLPADADLSQAFAAAEACGSGVLVERYVEGVDHRLIVIGGQFTAALNRVPPSVTGDGVRTLRQLLEHLNKDPYRDGFRMFPVPCDDELVQHLARQGLDLDAVPKMGRMITLRPRANVSTGGHPVDVTDRVHPDNVAAAEAAAVAIGLDVAGVDFISQDISKSHREIGGGIIEVNARPGLCMHTWPYEGQSRDVAGAVLRLAFPAGETGAVPAAVIAGDRGANTTARALHDLLKAAERVTGLCLKRTAKIGDLPLGAESTSQRQNMKAALRDPSLDALVAAVSIRRVARAGLGLESCDAAAILPQAANGDVESFLQGVDVMLKANRGRFVLGAGDVVGLDALASVPLERLFLISVQADHPGFRAHVARGGCGAAIEMRDGEEFVVVVDEGRKLLDAPARAGRRRSKLRDHQALLAAVALALSLGLSPEEVETAIKASRKGRASMTEHAAELGGTEHAP